MPETSSSAIHGYCLYDWDGTQWVLQQPHGNKCHPGYIPQPPNGGPSAHGNRTQGVPGTCILENPTDDNDDEEGDF